MKTCTLLALLEIVNFSISPPPKENSNIFKCQMVYGFISFTKVKTKIWRGSPSTIADIQGAFHLQEIKLKSEI